MKEFAFMSNMEGILEIFTSMIIENINIFSDT